MINRTRMIEVTDSGSGSTTKAEDQKRRKKASSPKQVYTNATVPAQTATPAAAPTTSAPENIHYDSSNYHWEETDTGGGYDKRQIVLRSPNQPARINITLYRDTTPGVLPTQEELTERMDTYNQWDAEMCAKIADAEEQVNELQYQKMSMSGRLYDPNGLGEILNQLRTEEKNLQRLKDEYYYAGMEQQKQFAQELYLRGGGTLWDVVLDNENSSKQIAQDRQKLNSMSASHPQRKALEQEIKQKIHWLNYAQQVASEYGINYNDLVEYAQWIEDEANMQESVQFWTDVVQKDDRSMNAANWASVPMNVIGGITSGISNALQSVNNARSGQYRPINSNTIWHYGTNVTNAVRNTTGDIVEDRLGGGISGQIGRIVYEQATDLADAALGWGIKQFIVGSNLVSGNMKTFLEDLEHAVDLVGNSAELMQTYQDALDGGLSPEEAFDKCMVQLASEGMWGLTEAQFNKAFLNGLADPDESLAMVPYQSPEQDDFMRGFLGEDSPASGKADFYVSPSGDVIPGEYESWIGDNQRDTILPQIEDQTLRSVVGQMYPKNSVIGTGSLPELIRFSEENGLNLVRGSRYQLVRTLSDYLTQATYSGTVSLADKNMLNMIMNTWR